MKQNEPKFDLPPDHAQFPVLPLRDVVVYPHMVIPLVCRPGEIHSCA
jgi:ATP-dependent Lon protease